MVIIEGDINILLGIEVFIDEFKCENKEVFKNCGCLVVGCLILLGIIRVFLRSDFFLFVVFF